ncbi:sodium/calcium exchanger 3-like isoform X1 [Styela clava]
MDSQNTATYNTTDQRTILSMNLDSCCRRQRTNFTTPHYLTHRGKLAIVGIFVFLYFSCPVSAQNTSASTEVDDLNSRCNQTRVCKRGVFLPVWPPTEVDLIPTADKVGRACVYFFSLFYLFLGVSIIADRFMASIEVITSKEKEVTVTKPNGEVIVTTVRVWNETVSNLTLMALGSSAPEIMLSVIEVIGKGFTAGELGPSTIVGSASFNLFIIIAICMYVIPDGEIRKVKHPRVFFITAVWSIMAYIWLYLILAVFSKGVVEIWEGVVTLLFFPMLVVLAWIADRRLLVYKYMYKRYRKRKHVIVETEGSATGELRDMVGAEEMRHLGKGSQAGTLSRSSDSLEGNISIKFDGDEDATWDTEAQKREMIRLLRNLKKKHPEADMQDLARMANLESLNQQHKSRAFYRIQATRKMTGAGNILKTKSDHANRDLSDSLQIVTDDADDLITKISFDPAEYKVMENCGCAELEVVRRGGDLNTTMCVDYRTEDGTANAGSDYDFTEGTVIFRPGETLHMIKIPIIDDDIFEEDEYFRVTLSNVRLSENANGSQGLASRTVRLEPPIVATVVILDDDHAGVFSFPDPSVTVSESVGILSIPVKRDSGARGCVTIPYKTVAHTATGGGEDYVDAFGELEFENDETMKKIEVPICDTLRYYKRSKLYLEMEEPYIPDPTQKDSYTGNDTGSDSGINGRDEEEERKLTDEEKEEAKRIAELGKPRLGDNSKIEIIIEESYEFKNTVDKLIKKANLAVIVGTSSWREQFMDALSVKGGDDDDGDAAEEDPTPFDYVMHFLTVFWKLLFAIVPPTDYFGGWACFTCSILVIGLLTAVIGDVASHFGCTINLNDAVTAVTLVAMGTSVPDTFASKVAAVGDQYADASIGNVTGSNAVNVFLGIGVAWTIAAVYWAIMGTTDYEKQFHVRPGNLAFSVTCFSVLAVLAIAILLIRRRSKKIGAELGGPRKYKIISSLIFVFFWVLYVVLSALDSYCIITTF